MASASGGEGGGDDGMFSDMLSRLQRLSERLAAKESEAIELSTRNRFLESDLGTARCEAAAAREELQQEATRAALLEQQLRRRAARAQLLLLFRHVRRQILRPQRRRLCRHLHVAQRRAAQLRQRRAH